MCPAHEITDRPRRDYNETRPHMALKELTPGEFARQYSLRPTAEGS
ncbi:integrase core domain-containing protein [Burkholderia cenocepacia]